nr:protein phosphatase 2C domain-containing protein [Actinomadura kijaniata]
MRVSFGSEATPGRVNEDFVVAGPRWAVVLDGATAPPGIDSGCAHDPGWLVRRLGGFLGGRLAVEGGEPLADLLAEGIKAVGEMHPACDLGNPDSPSATVAMVRVLDGLVEWLVLADSPVVVDDGGLVVVRDDRVDRLPSYTLEAVRAARNNEGGFWVAGTRPEAAYEALTGALPVERVRRVGVFSDGAARLVERFGLLGWDGLLDLLDRGGPGEVIRRTREVERATDPGGRGKRFDDATAVLLRF